MIDQCALLQSAISEYDSTVNAATQSEVRHDMESLARALSRYHEWTGRGAVAVVQLASEHGAFILRNALALAVVLDKEDGDLDFCQPIFRRLRSLGKALIPKQNASAARDRILYYFRQHPGTVIDGEELMVVSGIRKKKGSVQSKILDFLRANVGRGVTGEELRYVAIEKIEWARRVREPRTEHGWPVATRTTGRPDLPVGVYVLQADRQSPEHDRRIPDDVRREVLREDGYTCQECGWTHAEWNPSDPRHLELHHIKHHARGGKNVKANLKTLCNVCHDRVHRDDKRMRKQ